MTTALANTPARHIPSHADRVGELAVLPGGSMGIVKFTAAGVIKAVRTTVRLDETVGHLYDLRGSGGKNISAAGYDHINRAMGVSFHTPEFVVGEDGQQHCNPHVHRDKHDVVKRITIKMAGLWRNSLGNVVMFTTVLHYDLGPLLAQDMLKKWRPAIWDSDARKKVSQPEREWGQPYSAENVPEEVRHSPEHKCIDMPGGWVLAVKFKGDALDVLAEHANRVRFAVRNAETIARRRIMKACIGQQKLGADNTVTVDAWVNADPRDMQAVARAVEQYQSGDLMLDDQPVDVHAESVTVDDTEQEAEAIDRSAMDTEVAAPDEKPAPDPRPQAGSPVAKLRDEITALHGELDKADDILGAVGLTIDEIANCGDASLLQEGLGALQRVKMEALQKTKGVKPSPEDNVPANGALFDADAKSQQWAGKG